jgi:hypothetical protein
MARLRKTRAGTRAPLVVDLADAAWLAGIIDGEGTFALTHGGDSRTPNLRLAIYNTSETILSKVRRILGEAVISFYEKRDERSIRWAPCSNVIVGTDGTLRLYDPLRPHLTRQVDRLDAAVSFLRPRYAGRMRVTWTLDEIAEWEMLRERFNRK